MTREIRLFLFVVFLSLLCPAFVPESRGAALFEPRAFGTIYTVDR